MSKLVKESMWAAWLTQFLIYWLVIPSSFITEKGLLENLGLIFMMWLIAWVAFVWAGQWLAAIIAKGIELSRKDEK